MSLTLLLGLPALMKMDAVSDRAKDWRNGPIVYQVFVDRFVPPANLEAKRHLYRQPSFLKSWSETPRASKYDAKLKTYPHVLEFWGGDLPGVRSKLGYVKNLGADVLYLQPIFRSPSNHKYDTEDYFQIDPEYGTQADLKALIGDVHKAGMKIMLDGVFNHIGKTSPIFQEAFNNPKSDKRNWFFFGKEYPDGYRGWAGVSSLPGFQLETSAVRDYLWAGNNSVVRKYLRDGIDGWRLDVGFELGPEFLSGITHASHETKPSSAVVGEIGGYPSNWFPAVDGVFNYFAVSVSVDMVEGKVTGGKAGQMLGHMVEDAGIENLLKSWLVADNHDSPRLATVVPNQIDRSLVQTLLFTLPGSPVVYYGSEVGMTGAGDPEDRAPMRWDLVSDDNPDLAWVKKMIAVRKAHHALRYGDFTALDSDKLLAFTRTTERLKDSVIVVINPTGKTVKETFPTRIGRLMSWGELQDAISGVRIRTITGRLELEVKPRTAMILVPVTDPIKGYSPYNRVG